MKLKHVTENIDRTTGEVITTSKTFTVAAKNTEEFFFTFLSGLNAICHLSRPSDIKILALLCSKAEYNTGIVRLTTSDRKEIISKLNSTTQSFSNSMTRLRKEGLIVGDHGNYEINPHYFWKGTTDERNKLLRDKKMDILLKFKMNNESKA